jgi:hypothetical protein
MSAPTPRRPIADPNRAVRRGLDGADHLSAGGCVGLLGRLWGESYEAVQERSPGLAGVADGLVVQMDGL